MGDSLKKFDVDTIISHGDDLVQVLKDQRDINSLTQCFEQTRALSSSCNDDFNRSQVQLQDYQRKLDECRQKTEKAKLETVSDAEMELLDKELHAERENERLLLEELR
ncbi:hypothetical protein Tsubulata_017894 [Turnera subulata]|uniref:Uncharacterized protein n=1 Tax=Turnera subulata TaxID=218843 RepID=A0A9Q0J0I0_9ROSI|nr:hypothetical protein Tsubulata_017894 [Turnera subulata]